MRTAEKVYLGHDNSVDLLLKAGGSAVDLSSVTRMVLELSDGTSFDSDTDAGVFDWDTGTTGKLIISLGGETIDAGTYHATLIVYDPTNPNGIVWGRFNLVVQ
jgi:hypothetical protein